MRENARCVGLVTTAGSSSLDIRDVDTVVEVDVGDASAQKQTQRIGRAQRAHASKSGAEAVLLVSDGTHEVDFARRRLDAEAEGGGGGRGGGVDRGRADGGGGGAAVQQGDEEEEDEDDEDDETATTTRRRSGGGGRASLLLLRAAVAAARQRRDDLRRRRELSSRASGSGRSERLNEKKGVANIVFFPPRARPSPFAPRPPFSPSWQRPARAARRLMLPSVARLALALHGARPHGAARLLDVCLRIGKLAGSYHARAPRAATPSSACASSAPCARPPLTWWCSRATGLVVTDRGCLVAGAEDAADALVAASASSPVLALRCPRPADAPQRTVVAREHAMVFLAPADAHAADAPCPPRSLRRACANLAHRVEKQVVPYKVVDGRHVCLACLSAAAARAYSRRGARPSLARRARFWAAEEAKSRGGSRA